MTVGMTDQNPALARIAKRRALLNSPFVSDVEFRRWYEEDVSELLQLSANLVETILKGDPK